MLKVNNCYLEGTVIAVALKSLCYRIKGPKKLIKAINPLLLIFSYYLSKSRVARYVSVSRVVSSTLLPLNKLYNSIFKLIIV